MKTRTYATACMAIAMTATTASSATVAYWNFNNLSIASASAPNSGGVPASIIADTGNGTLSLMSWTGTVDDFGGSSLNVLNGDLPGASLSLLAASGNGGAITLQLSMTGLRNPLLSFATQGTGTGFNSNQLAWSLDGNDYTDFGTAYVPAAAYALQSFDLSSVDALDGAAAVWLRLTFSGASSATGNNRIDNVRVNAVPEPSCWLLAGSAALTLLRRRR